MSHGSRTAAASDGTCAAERHGSTSAYDWWGCRCPEAREAWRIYRKRLRSNRQPPANMPALGTARRLQALVALGHGWTDLAPQLGISIARVRQIATNPAGMVHRGNAAKVAEVYERLSGTRGSTAYAFTVAARNGWVPPLAWDDIDNDGEPGVVEPEADDFVDEVAVERALAGHDIELTDAELIAALQVGTARGASLTALAVRFGLSNKTAETMLGGVVPARRRKQKLIEAAILADPSEPTLRIAKRLGVEPVTVRRAKQRMASTRTDLAS
jgi:lambda repressor-like predicted transcriptional regulator